MTETTASSSADIEAPADPGSPHHIGDIDETSREVRDEHSSQSHHCQSSSRVDHAECFGDEASHQTYDIEESTNSKSGSTVTTATATSSSNDTPAPLPDSSGKNKDDANRTTSSRAFSIGISELDHSYRSNDSRTSLYNRLAATAMEEARERKSQLCCGSCCDLVTGTVVTNGIMTLLIVFVLAIVLPSEKLMGYFGNFLTSRTSYVLGSIGIVIASVGTVSARIFCKWPVLLTGIWCIFQLVLGILERRIGLSLLSACFAYPNIHLFLALHSGNIHKDNYKRTEQYCCCSCGKQSEELEDDCC